MKIPQKIILIILLLIAINSLFPESLSFRFICSGAAYYPEYPDYDYDSPVTGCKFDAEIFNIIGNFGIGGSAFLQIRSYDKYFQSMKIYDAYIHHFDSYQGKDSYFIYGFFGGVQRTDLKYEDYKTSQKFELLMTKPLLGFHFSTHQWGFTLTWTQTENEKPRLGYEVKFRDSSGVIFQIGRSTKGPIEGAKSDFHIYTGYEFFM
ncbi:MAG: hypothetical protein HQ534_05025 [Armatimonadetes bacterium]|nr:hypothetical protein [Armatimonadota bacterium]